MRKRKPIYVESRIRGAMDELWAKTQQPELHQRWDLRFGEISYAPRAEGEPQRFTYATKVAPGVRIAGVGESLGEKDRADGGRWSGLKYWANDWRSPIKARAGYWRYLPTDDGIRFLTRYDYRPRWGQAGEAIDRLAFRPVFGWATAWSFDRLRLWLEEGTPPERARNQAVAHASAVTALAGAWLYHGLVPKLLAPDPMEAEMVRRSGVAAARVGLFVKLMGVGEAALGAWMVARPRSRAPFALSLAGITGLTVGAWRADRRVFTKAFNPVSINLALFALGVVALSTAEGLPSGRTPLRSSPDVQPQIELLPEDNP